MDNTKIRGLFALMMAACAFCASFASGESQRLPKDFLLCNVTDQNYNGCLTKAAQQAYQLLRNGLDDFDIKPISPLYIDQVDVEQGDGLVKVSLILKNVTLAGLDNIQVLSMSNEIPSGGCDMKSEAHVPQLSVLSNYSVNGKVLLLPVNGNGIGNITMNNVNVKVIMKCDRFEKDGEEFLNVTSFRMAFKPKSALIHMHNLFNGDPILEKAMNQLLNDNALEILREMNPAIEETFGHVFRNISNKIFHKVPLKTIFLH